MSDSYKKEYYKNEKLDELCDSIIDDMLFDLASAIEEPAGSGCGYGFDPSAYDIVGEYMQEFSDKLKELKNV